MADNTLKRKSIHGKSETNVSNFAVCFLTISLATFPHCLRILCDLQENSNENPVMHDIMFIIKFLKLVVI